MELKANSGVKPEEWIEHYGDYLYSYAFFRLSSVKLAEDAVQETFLAALKSQKRFKGESSEKTWLVSILKRKIIDHYRKQYRSGEVKMEDSPFLKEGDNDGSWDPSRIPGNWIEEGIMELERQEFYNVLEMCLSLLPEKWASVFKWKTMEEYSTDDICKEIGISASNLWVIMHRARLRLRECFEKNWFNG